MCRRKLHISYKYSQKIEQKKTCTIILNNSLKYSTMVPYKRIEVETIFPIYRNLEKVRIPMFLNNFIIHL